MSQLRRQAVIDLGSNSVRMLVVEADQAGRWRVIDEARALLRLGECLDKHGSLAPLQGTASWLLGSWAARTRQLGVDGVAAVGTAALRTAPDGAAFARALERSSGIPIRIIDGQEEARLGFLGALGSLDLGEGQLVDLGGASTEISTFKDRNLQRAVSLPLGSVTLGRRFFKSDPPTPAQLAAAEKAARKAVQELVPDPRSGLPLVAVGGSFRSLAKIQQRASAYPFPSLHNYQMAPGAIDALYQRLARLPYRQRRRLPGLAAHRAETVLSALTLARAVSAWLEPSLIVISGAGLREGLLLEQLPAAARPGPGQLLADSVHNLLFQLGERPNPPLAQLADALARALAPLLPDSARPLILAAAELRGLGRRVNFYDRHLETFYLVTHARLFGLSHPEQVVLAAASGYEGPHRLTQSLRPYARLLGPGEGALAARLGLVVAYAEALHQRALPAQLEFAALVSAKEIALTVRGLAEPPAIPYDDLDRLGAHFAKVFGRRLRCRYLPA